VSATVDSREQAATSSSTTRPQAVSISHVSKTFRIPREQQHTLKERAVHPFRRRQHDILEAVRDVSLDICQGEFFGIVGRNGSGKSTLLKCLAGIYSADAGEIAISGRLSPFIELGVGFNPNLAARDNVTINAIMLGLSRKEAQARFDSVIDFAELQEFTELRLKNYSSGMQVRLAFSVAVQVDADILLMDEVLAVGDAAFQRKCFDEFVRLKSLGKTIVIVTHDMGAIERFCDRAMLIERGRVLDVGDPGSIARQYNDTNFKRARRDPAPASGDSPTIAVAALQSARFESPDGEPIVTIPQSEPCCVRFETQFNDDVESPVFTVSLRNEFGLTAFAANTQLSGVKTGRFGAGELAVIRLRFDNCLAPGRYTMMASVTRDGPVGEIFDVREDLCSIIVHGEHAGGGVVDLPHTFELEHGS
jgi:ABC-type polysaccharide/polyol phosphate transport system ATPase subunit